MIDSVKFAKKLEQIQTYQSSNITFVIAGSLGPGQNIYKRCNYRLKLSDMTFTHQMTRVILLEQIYQNTSCEDRHDVRKIL